MNRPQANVGTRPRTLRFFQVAGEPAAILRRDTHCGIGRGSAYAEGARNASSIASVSFASEGLTVLVNQAASLPSRPIRILWKFHLGAPCGPVCSRAQR